MLGKKILQAVMYDTTDQLTLQASRVANCLAEVARGDLRGAESIEGAARRWGDVDQTAAAMHEVVVGPGGPCADPRSTVVDKPAEGPFQILADPGESGDGIVVPGVWGKFGASGIVIRHVDENGVVTYLMTKAAPGYSQGKWQLAGGARAAKETPAQGAAREAKEELGATQDYLNSLTVLGEHIAHGPAGWTYTSFATTAPRRFEPVVDGVETEAAGWITHDDLLEMRARGEIHSALAKNLDDILSLYNPPTGAD